MFSPNVIQRSAGGVNKNKQAGRCLLWSFLSCRRHMHSPRFHHISSTARRKQRPSSEVDKRNSNSALVIQVCAMALFQSEALASRWLKFPEETKTPYGYIPHFPINITFLVVYSILALGSAVSVSLCLHKKHRRWLIRNVLVATGITIELIGFVERVRGANNPRNYNDFMVQLALLNLAPAFMTAA